MEAKTAMLVGYWPSDSLDDALRNPRFGLSESRDETVVVLRDRPNVRTVVVASFGSYVAAMRCHLGDDPWPADDPVAGLLGFSYEEGGRVGRVVCPMEDVKRGMADGASLGAVPEIGGSPTGRLLRQIRSRDGEDT